MTKLDASICCLFMAFTLFYEIVSQECDANMFYDFTYCLSSNSQCAPCLPCYNNAELYIPTGKQYGTSCNDNDICKECTANCANFNAVQYHTKYIQSTDTDPSCPLLSNFIGEMNSTIFINISINTQYQYACDDEYVVSIKYAFIVASDYTSNDAQNCIEDISNPLKDECDELQNCAFNIYPYIQNNTCGISRGFHAFIGSFCISKDPLYSPNKLTATTVDEAVNSIPLTDAFIWTLIIIPWSIIILALIFLIYYLMRQTGYMQCMQCKKVSDSERKLNKKRSSERVNSETVVSDPNNNTKILSIDTKPRARVLSHKSIPIYASPSNDSNSAQTGANTHTYHTQQHRSHNPAKGNHRIVQQARYQNMKNSNSSNTGLNATPVPAQLAQTAFDEEQPPITSQDSIVVRFRGKGVHPSNVGQTQSAVSAMTYRAIHEGFDPAIPVTNERHNRNTSVVVNNTGPLAEHINGNGAWGAHNDIQHIDVDYLVGSHPLSTLNQSGIVPPYDTNAVDELAHSLVSSYRSAVANNNNETVAFEQNQEYYNHYWNQYYGIPPQPQPQQNMDYPDFANPNGDYTMNLSYDDSKIETVLQNEIMLEAEIGRGSSSKVFKARWRNTEVAAKRFAPTVGIDTKKAKTYIDEYAMKVNKKPHENVVKLLAFSTKPFTILTEYMNKGSVKNYVRRTRPGSTSISILDRIEIALQAAKGIDHLHELGIIHSEINCQNLLMEIINSNDEDKEKIRVVVTDYALQNILSGDELETYRSSLGPLKWMAPECIENSSSPTTFESDIYAFGITMWEIITGQEPYPDVDPVDTAIHVLVKERRPQSYAFIPEKIQNLMKICWHKHAGERPTAKKVVTVLTEFVQTERKQNADRNDLL